MSSHSQRNRVRIEITRQELARLGAEIDGWLKAWRARDQREQYHTQFNVLETVLHDALRSLATRLDGVTAGSQPGTVYTECRAFEERAVWVRRVWDFYRVKFDQRLNPPWADTLRAADEIIWSCYQEPFRNRPPAADDVAPASTPLPFIDNAYSPNMLPRSEPPSELLRLDDPALRQFISELPIPLVGIPPRSVDAPWWLVFIAHEAGHHVQNDVRGGVLVSDFAQALHAMAEAGAASPRWKFWAQEIFADVYSVSLMGQWALWALCDLETQTESAMTAARPQYPAPLVRLNLLAHVADALGAAGMATTRARAVPAADPAAAADLAIAARIAPDLARWAWGDLGAWSALCDWRANDFASGGAVDDWTRALRGQAVAPSVNPDLRDVRLVLCGAVQAWAQVAELENDRERGEAREQLARRTFDAIQQSREAGQRPADMSAAPAVEGKGHALAELLMRMDLP